MSQRDYYEVLGVSKNATEKEVEKAYRSLVSKFHPDRWKTDEEKKEAQEKFVEIQAAYEVLSNAEKRRRYDQFGHAGVDPSMGGGAGSADFSHFKDMFEEIFFGGGFGGGGGGRRRGGPSRGSDLGYDLEITLEQAFHGCSAAIRVPCLVSCKVCHGSGAKEGSKKESCGTCGGHGEVRMQQGFFTIQQTCPQCHGQGQVIKDPCRSCNGHGVVRDQKNLSVKIPKGIQDGDRVRLGGEGEAGTQGGPAGDLYVQIHVKEHAVFERRDNHLYCEVPVSFAAATLGGEVEIPTIDGKVKLKIPAETQSGTYFKVAKKGFPSVRGAQVGDMMCKVVVETPVGLSSKQKELLQSFEKSLTQGGDHNPKSSKWFKNVKKFFEA